MTASGFAYGHRFAKGTPAPAPRWTGFPRYNFIGGHNAPEHIPGEAMATIAADVLRRDGAKLALYNADGPQGLLALRAFVVKKVAERGIRCTADDVLITAGSGQGLDLVNRLFLDRGDTVILEEFTYGGAISKLQRRGVTIVGAPLDADGLRIDALAGILDDLGRKRIVPKFLYTIPTIQNPTGSILPIERREALLALTGKHGVPIFEDECYADLLFGVEAPPALYAMDPRQVVHIGSFSKTLSPALRLGYAVADPAAMSRLVAMKREGDSGTGALEQMVVAEFFARDFDGHVGALNRILEDKLATMSEAVAREFGTAVEQWRPKGGIFLWLKFPDDIDVRKLVEPAARAGIVFNPGPEWACNGEGARSHMRLCFAYPSKEEIRDGVAALAQVCYEETGIPVRSANIRRAAAPR
ncbi:MAG TPA: PLP-dependent aminotransferase family protein [Stellaceae bacterium]|nr:PLP-dependent aminotransferase family protein [Stellaceae bacterium]